VYDVTRRETFTNLSDIWAKEVELYSTNHECIKILLGNKVDRVSCMFTLCFPTVDRDTISDVNRILVPISIFNAPFYFYINC
jgi:hypothetical protein